VVLAPPALYTVALKDSLKGSSVHLAVQNVSDRPGSGALTGELSTSMLTDLQIPWAILGHSERRQIFGESSELVGKKLMSVSDTGISAILCVGETLEEREAGRTDEVVQGQLSAALDCISTPIDTSRLVIAYEPVWAIGTGRVATPAQAQSMHSALRSFLANRLDASSIRIIYGGSVTAANSQELATCPDIDGFLVGGAALKPEFMQIVQSCDN